MGVDVSVDNDQKDKEDSHEEIMDAQSGEYS